MKTIIFCMFAVAAVAVAFPAAAGDRYTDKYDNVNLDEILGNRRLLEPYLKCMADEGRCTADGKELKSHIREALEDDCAKCTDVQRRGTRRVINHLIKHEQVYWGKLKAKYDTHGKYSKKYEDELESVTKV